MSLYFPFPSPTIHICAVSFVAVAISLPRTGWNPPTTTRQGCTRSHVSVSPSLSRWKSTSIHLTNCTCLLIVVAVICVVNESSNSIDSIGAQSANVEVPVF